MAAPYSANSQRFIKSPSAVFSRRTFINKLIFNNLSGILFIEYDDGIGNAAFSLIVKLAVV